MSCWRKFKLGQPHFQNRPLGVELGRVEIQDFHLWLGCDLSFGWNDLY